MGMSILNRSCKSCTPTSGNSNAPNPNPEGFVILGAEQIGRNVVAIIKYVGCTNFEGVKVCVYRGVTCSQIRNMKILDPHFSEQGIAPFARFEPTLEGKNAAREFARQVLK